MRVGISETGNISGTDDITEIGVSETGDISGTDDITEIGVSETGDNMEGKSWVYYRSQDNIAMLTRRLIRALDTLQKTPKIIKIKKNSKE